MCLAHFIGRLEWHVRVGHKIEPETVLINLLQWWWMENWGRDKMAATLYFQIDFPEWVSLYSIRILFNFVTKGTVNHN